MVKMKTIKIRSFRDWRCEPRPGAPPFRPWWDFKVHTAAGRGCLQNSQGLGFKIGQSGMAWDGTWWHTWSFDISGPQTIDVRGSKMFLKFLTHGRISKSWMFVVLKDGPHVFAPGQGPDAHFVGRQLCWDVATVRTSRDTHEGKAMVETVATGATVMKVCVYIYIYIHSIYTPADRVNTTHVFARQSAKGSFLQKKHQRQL